MKRRWAWLREEERFSSTASIASAPYRQAVLQHLADPAVRRAVESLERAGRELETAPETLVPGLGQLVPEHGPGRWLAGSGGPWVYPDQWQLASVTREAGERDDLARLADAGRTAARDLFQVMKAHGVPLAAYLAVVVQDIDSMGRFLSGGAPASGGKRIEVSPGEHGRVSSELLAVASAQRTVLRSADLLGVPVYAGGDDLLAFTPAAGALRAAQACHATVPASLPTASTAVLYFHYHASIQQAMTQARRMLEAAKSRGPEKHGLAVGFLRRSGASAVSVQPWAGPDGGDSAGLFQVFAREQERRLSPRLAADLQRDAAELDALARADERLYEAELARLVRRHAAQGDQGGRGAAVRAAAALAWLGRHEHAPDQVPGPHIAAQVGVFLRQEAR
jgi:hypothetical protein